MKVFLALGLALAVSVCALPCRAGLVISQYYEGPSTNKWIELYNWGDTAVNLATVAVGHWNNANAEGYKTNVAPSFTFTLSGSLPAGGVYVLGNTGNTTPAYAVTEVPDATSNTVINFNGNDSIAIYTAGTFATANLIDVIGFTNAGNEGQDKSFVRSTTAPGYSLTAGSDVLDFPTVWQEVTLATVNGAGASTTERIGFATITIVPEASPLALVGAVASVAGLGQWLRRRRSGRRIAG